MTTLAFDVYGTLVDTQAMTKQLQTYLGEKAAAFATSWRAKQLEYTFRRTLMDAYQDFDVCTAQALQYCSVLYDLDLSEVQQQDLLDAYRQLPAYPETADVLSVLNQRAETACHAFSNGTRESVESVLRHNDLRTFFGEVISADEIGQFKPHRSVYRLFEEKTATPAASCWLISANPFDVTGALAAGWQAVWLQRSATAVFDPWEYRPTAVVQTLREFSELPAISAQS